jgi:hypothetical protein
MRVLITRLNAVRGNPYRCSLLAARVLRAKALTHEPQLRAIERAATARATWLLCVGTPQRRAQIALASAVSRLHDPRPVAEGALDSACMTEIFCMSCLFISTID